VKPGQTRDQVKFILGTPLLMDVFHKDRWDYPFYLARGNGEVTSSRVSVYFKDEKVDHFDGGNLPSEREYIRLIAGPVKEAPTLGPKKEAPGKVNIEAGKGTEQR
jgi:outer membrane protein assembly factor BamE